MKNFFRKFWGAVLVLVLSWWAVQPVFHSGFFPVHDDTQVVRVYEMAQALGDFQFPVRWVADLGYGFGYPLFNFYAPLPYYVGALFNLIGFDPLLATKIMFVLGISLSGLFMYLLARDFFGELGGILAGAFYVYAPYHAVDVYVRGAVAEFWAMAFLPLTIWGFYKLALACRWRWVVVGASGLAGVILSHNLTAMIFVPLLSLGLVVYWAFCLRNKFLHRKKFLCSLRPTLLAFLLGLGFSSFYWLPSLLEMKFTAVALQVGGGADFRDHFVCLSQLWSSPWGFGGSAPGCASDGMSFQVGKLYLILAFFTVILGLYWWRRERKKSLIILFAIGYFLFAIFMTTQYSKTLWEVVKPMAYIQYPWRFLTFVILTTSFLVGAFLYFFKSRFLSRTIFLFLLVALLFFQVKYFQPKEYINLQAKDYLSDENIKWKTSKISDEFLPPDFPKPKNPNEVPKEKIILLEASSQLSDLKIKSNHYSFTLQGENVSLILARLAYFPGWKVFADGREKFFMVQKGQILFSVPKGKHQVELIFQNTLVRTLGNSISLLSMVILIGGVFYGRKKVKN